MKISEEMKEKAQAIEEKCSLYFRAKNEVSSRKRDESTCLARSFTWHILHEVCKMSVATIAIIYHRTPRNVQYTLSKMRFLTSNTKDFDIYMQDLMEGIER